MLHLYAFLIFYKYCLTRAVSSLPQQPHGLTLPRDSLVCSFIPIFCNFQNGLSESLCC